MTEPIDYCRSLGTSEACAQCLEHLPDRNLRAEQICNELPSPRPLFSFEAQFDYMAVKGDFDGLRITMAPVFRLARYFQISPQFVTTMVTPDFYDSDADKGNQGGVGNGLGLDLGVVPYVGRDSELVIRANGTVGFVSHSAVEKNIDANASAGGYLEFDIFFVGEERFLGLFAGGGIYCNLSRDDCHSAFFSGIALGMKPSR